MIAVAEAGGEKTVGVDLVILARGTMPEPTALALLRTVVPEVYAVGDSVEPSAIAEALYEGALAGSRM